MSVDAAPEASGTILDETATDPSAVHYRYPGSPPFQDTELDRRLFRGRAQEADTVLHSILSADLFLLYAVSGMGKTSLLNAGVMHELRARQYWPVSVRLNDPSKPPVAEIREQIEDAAEGDPEIELLLGAGHEETKEEDAGPDTSLWGLLSSLEVWRGNDLQRLVVVFDQFEELFTLGWDDAEREEFISQFGEVVRGHRRHGPDAPNGLGTPPPVVKFVLVIREDALGELEALATEIPQIMRNRFRLVALDPVQAAAAIREPARVADGRLDSQPFAYTEAAIQEILDFLRTTTVRGEAVRSSQIDPPQLQIVCQYVERAILPSKGAPPPGDVIQIDAADLGGREGLERILGDFYRRTLQTFPASQLKPVRELCERGLINPGRRRISLEEGAIADSFGVSREMLHQLVDQRLLRADPRVGSVYYELAHDTLVPPIRAFAEEDRTRRRRRRRRWLALAIAGLAVGVVALLAFTLGSDTADEGASAQPLSVGESVTGSVDVPGDDVRFSVQADEGQTLIASVRPVGTDAADGDAPGPGGQLNPAFELTTNDGAKRQQDQLGTGQAEQMVVAPVSGDRQELVVTSFDSTTGAFELTLDEVPVVDVAPGTVEFGNIGAAGAVAVFRVEISGGAPTAVDITTPTPEPDEQEERGQSRKGGLDVEVELLDPAGISTTIDTLQAGNGERVQVSGTDGQYILVVRGHEDSIGQFQLEAGSVTRTLTVGEAETGEIDGSDAAEFTVEVAGADSYVVVAIEPDPEFDPVLDIAPPQGADRFIDSGGEGGLEIAVLGPTPGRYLLSVSGFERSTGQFTVETIEVTRMLTVGQPETGEIESSDVVGFTLAVPQGSPPVLVTVDPDPTFDAELGIVGPDGEIQDIDDQGAGGAEVALVRPTSGSYLVGIAGFDSSAGGFEVIANPIQPRRLEAGDTDTGNGLAIFEVEVTGDEDLQFVAEPSSADTHVEIEVTDPEGFPVDYISGEPGQPASVEIEDQVGVYQLVVKSHGEPRDFTVTVTGEVDTDGDDD